MPLLPLKLILIIAFLIRALVKISFLIISLIALNLINTLVIRNAFKSFALINFLVMPIA